MKSCDNCFYKSYQDDLKKGVFICTGNLECSDKSHWKPDYQTLEEALERACEHIACVRCDRCPLYQTPKCKGFKSFNECAEILKKHFKEATQ